ncbi:MAG TPA: rod shape-determining protein MreC [Candidatus Saccharimonadales bacterium]|nr:rod shape-determining protein MreC [Candidatus Saccharimonadales bacterium]
MRSRRPNLFEFRFYPLLLLAGGLLFLFISIGFLNPILSFTQGVTLPLQISFHNLTSGVGSVLNTATHIGSLRNKNSDLQVENAALKAENAALKKLKAENQSLRAQIGSKVVDLKINQAAHVIGLGGFGTKSVLLIDAGKNDGVSKGELAVVKSILLGKVVDVSPKVSSVQLLSDPSTKIPVRTESGAEGILEGRFGQGVVLTNVVQSAKLVQGELIFTSGKDNYPANLAVGKIDKVNKVEKEFFQSASVENLVNPNDLALVYLAKN